VPLHPPKDGASRTSSASGWTIDFDELERTINPKTRMIVSATFLGLCPGAQFSSLTYIPGSEFPVSRTS
jgi:hypothetical protein